MSETLQEWRVAYRELSKAVEAARLGRDRDERIDAAFARIGRAGHALEQEMNALRAAAKRWGWVCANGGLTVNDIGTVVLHAGVADTLQEAAAWLAEDEVSSLAGHHLPPGKRGLLQPGWTFRPETIDRAVDANIAAEIADAQPPHPPLEDVRDEEASGGSRKWDGLDFGGGSGKW